MALRTISKSIDLNSSSNKYITDINNNGIQIHEAGYNASNYDKNIILNSSGIQLNSGNLQLMGLDEDSLDFYTVDTINNQSNPVASFSSNGAVFSNLVDEDDEEVTYSTVLNSNLSFLRNEEILASFSSNGATIGSETGVNVSLNPNGISLNNGIIQYATFSQEGLELNTSTGSRALGIYTSGSKENTPVRKFFNKTTGWSAGTTFPRRSSSYVVGTFATDLSPESCGSSGIKIRFSPYITKNNPSTSNLSTITITESFLTDLTSSDNSVYTWENIASYYNSSNKIGMSVDLQLWRTKHVTEGWRNWNLRYKKKRTNESDTSYTLQNNWYWYYSDISYIVSEEVPKNVLYGSTLSSSYRTADNIMINSYMKISGDSNVTTSVSSTIKEIPLPNLQHNYGNAFEFDTTTRRIKVLSAGNILVWGSVRLGNDFGSSANAIYCTTVCYAGNVEKESIKGSRFRTSGSTVRTDVNISPRVLSAQAGDEISMTVYNDTESKGNLINGSCALCALYLGPVMANNI